MAFHIFLRSSIFPSRSSARGLRCFLSGLAAPAKTVQVDPHPEFTHFTDAARADDIQQKWKQYRRSRTWRRLGKLAVFGFGFVPVYLMFNPPEEEHLAAAIERDLGKQPAIRTLLEDAATKPLRGAYAEINLDRRTTSTLTDETLHTSKLLGPKRAFWNHSEQELLYFQWFGILLGGWPTVVHGGAIATALSEAMSRAAACMQPTAEPFPEPTSLSLTYLKPTRVRDYYRIRVRPIDTTASHAAGPSLPPLGSTLDREGHEIGPGKDLTKQPLPSEPPASDDEYLQLEATLENATGKVLVKARASFRKQRAG